MNFKNLSLVLILAIIFTIGCSGSSDDTPNPTESKKVVFTGLTANGSSNTVTTTALTLTFDVDPATLDIGDITIEGATKDTLTGSGLTRTLAISAISVLNGAAITVTLANPTGFTLTPVSKTVAVNVFDNIVGTWITIGNYSTDREKFVFNADGTFTRTTSTDSGSIYSTVDTGTFTHSISNKAFTTVSSGINGTKVYSPIVIVGTTMYYGSVLSSGTGVNLIGEWTQTLTTTEASTGNGVHTTKLKFDASNMYVYYTSLIAPDATGAVSVNTTLSTLTVSGSTNTGFLPDGTYNYVLIDNVINISRSPTDLTIWQAYIKQ